MRDYETQQAYNILKTNTHSLNITISLKSIPKILHFHLLLSPI